MGIEKGIKETISILKSFNSKLSKKWINLGSSYRPRR